MLNYNNLNDVEFEALCNDIMSRMLNIPLRCFGPGRDGGVDLSDDAAEKNIVVQVKHYRSSTPEQLIRSLKKELPKVQKLNPRQYYICCSRMLSAENIRELYQHFDAYMDSSWNIVTLKEIDDFLKNEKNRDILEKHFKLWLDDTGILEDIFGNELFVDCDVLLDDIERQQQFFVQTEAFDQALIALENRQILCIVGNPGVGKSITSNMLVLRYAALGYRVRYTSDVTDLSSLKRSISQDSSKKEIILLDDCFGQAYFEMRSEQSTALVSLIKYVRRHPNKHLILNSRVTIFHEAQQRYPDFSRSLNYGDLNIFVLDMNSLSDTEKAKILYNHLYFKNIPEEYFADIRKEQHYHWIIRHRNYSPRIIEHVCTPCNFQNVSADSFFSYIYQQLNNPQEIWDNEYRYRLQPVDRELLLTIYSMTTTTVNAYLVRRVYLRRIKSIPEIYNLVDPYRQALQRLTEGFIKSLDINGIEHLSMVNPSVNDFLTHLLQESDSDYDKVIDSICNEKQLRLIPQKHILPYAVDLVKSGRINDFIFAEPYHRNRFIARCILNAELYLEQYIDAIHDFLTAPSGQGFWRDMSDSEHDRIAMTMQKSKFWNFYHLKDPFAVSNHLALFLNHFDLEAAISVIKTADLLYPVGDDAGYIQQVELFLDQAIRNFCQEDSDAFGGFVAFDALISRASINTANGQEIDISFAASLLEKEIRDFILSALHLSLSELPERFQRYTHTDFSEFVIVNGAEDTISSYLAEVVYDTFDDWEEWDGAYDDDTISPIDAIFER